MKATKARRSRAFQRPDALTELNRFVTKLQAVMERNKLNILITLKTPDACDPYVDLDNGCVEVYYYNASGFTGGRTVQTSRGTRLDPPEWDFQEAFTVTTVEQAVAHALGLWMQYMIESQEDRLAEDELYRDLHQEAT